MLKVCLFFRDKTRWGFQNKKRMAHCKLANVMNEECKGNR